jgi:PAS domain S-box-containing protein
VEELVGKTFWAFIPREEHDRLRADLERLTPEEPLLRVENRLATADGERWTLWTNQALLFDQEGGLVEAQSVGIDITERKRAEERLRASEARYRTLIEAVSAVSWTCPPSGLHVEPQPEWMAFTGQAAEEMMGDGWTRVTHPDDAPIAAQRWAAAAAAGISFESEHRVRRRDGAWRWMRVIAAPVRDTAGEIVSWAGMNIDVTERVEAEAKARDVQRLQSLLLDSTVAFIGILNPDGTLREANAPALMAGGLAREDVVGKKFWDCFWWSHDASEVARLQEAVATARAGEVVRYDAVVRMAGDSRMTIDFMLSPVRDETGAVTCLVPSAFDITDRMRVEAALRDSEARYRTLFESIDQGFCVVEVRGGGSEQADYRVLQANPAFEKNTGLPPEMLGRWLREAKPDLEDEWFETYAQVAATGRAQRFERWSDALGRWFDVFAFPMHGHSANHVAILFDDISARKHQEEHASLLLREVNHRAKNLLGVVQAIAKQTVATHPEDFSDRFQRRLQALATNQDLLVKGDWKSVPLMDLARSQVAWSEDRLSLSGPAVAVTAQAAQTLSMALHELATNAAKHGALSNETGRVDLAWRIEAGATGGTRLLIIWRELFGPRVTPPAKRGFGSTVLEQVVKASLRGTAELEFASNGVVWTLDCDAESVLVGAPPTLDLPAAGSETTFGRPRVLVVEDEALIAIDIAEALEAAGFEVAGPVGSVREALRLIDGCCAGVLDVNLGTETSEPVATALTHAGLPFVVVSGYARDQQPISMREAPLVGKPLNPDALLAQLRSCMDSAEGRAAAAL